MDDVFEFAARFLLRCLLALLQIIAQLVLEFVFFYTGKALVAVLTLGAARTVSLADETDEPRRTAWRGRHRPNALGIGSTIAIGALPYIALVIYFILR